MSDAIYVGVAVSTGDGRAGGHVATSDGLLDLSLAIPKELGGAGGATNPEQLFAAGWASCFHSALKLVASQKKIQLTDSVVTAEVGLKKGDHGHYEITAAIRVDLPGLDRADADAIVDRAHQVCPYSVATRGNVPVELSVSIG